MPASPRPLIVVVEDEKELAALIVHHLEAAGMQTQHYDRAAPALRFLQKNFANLLLLDINLPDSTGFQLLSDLKKDDVNVPTIFLTGNTIEANKIKGLEMGGDDYITKPFSYPELVARINAVLRRRRAVSPIEFGGLRLDPARRKVERQGRAIDLSPREYDLLFALVEANGQTIPRDRFLKEIWGMEFDPGTNVLDVQIGRLRKKLDRHGPPLIETVRGEGYRLIKVG